MLKINAAGPQVDFWTSFRYHKINEQGYAVIHATRLHECYQKLCETAIFKSKINPSGEIFSSRSLRCSKFHAMNSSFSTSLLKEGFKCNFWLFYLIL
ncbi:hypothetical protein RclHR1_01680013 [Rhizophagus clarus]|uniref:Uncharacterized protein n=1 Tax=Rhizophagus clarus TaxID=94130 RepID=A0A2Z6QMJ1_9GLOM|nr:hypothetical protein RclHR1_01680013 [Rhizophagus clarus]GES93380.1 hypothetical protein RCL_jg21175.t1 [Rhizophagus clarus]